MNKMQYEIIFGLSKDLLCLIDLDGYFIEVNNAWIETLGYSRDQVIGKQFIEFVHPEDIESTQSETNQYIKGNPKPSFVNRYRTHSGSYIYLEWSATIKDKLFLATAKNITDQYALNMQSKNMLLIQKFVGDSLNRAFFTMVKDEFVYSNIRFSELFEKSFSELDDIDQYMNRNMDVETKEWTDFYKNILCSDVIIEDVSKEFRLKKGNEVEAVEFNVKRQMIDGKKSILICTINDLTDVYRREALLRASLESAQAANESKKRFIANISHDLRTPLNGNLGMIEIAKMDLTSEAYDLNEIVSYLNDALESGKKLAHIIDEVIEFSDMDELLQETSLNELDLRESVDRIINDFKVSHSSVEFDVKTSFDYRIPNTMITDKVMFEKILMLVLTHISKFSDYSDIMINVEKKYFDESVMTLSIQFTTAKVTIEQSASMKLFGISGDDVLYDLDPFEDLGIGLQFAKVLLKKLGGRIWVETKLEKGNFIGIDLPVTFRKNRHLNQATAKSGKSICVVSPRNSIYMSLVQLLEGVEKINYTNNCIEAFQMFKKSTYDLALVSNKVDDMSYKEVIAELRLIRPDAKIVVLYQGDKEEIDRSIEVEFWLDENCELKNNDKFLNKMF